MLTNIKIENIGFAWTLIVTTNQYYSLAYKAALIKQLLSFIK